MTKITSSGGLISEKITEKRTFPDSFYQSTITLILNSDKERDMMVDVEYFFFHQCINNTEDPSEQQMRDGRNP